MAKIKTISLSAILQILSVKRLTWTESNSLGFLLMLYAKFNLLVLGLWLDMIRGVLYKDAIFPLLYLVGMNRIDKSFH